MTRLFKIHWCHTTYNLRGRSSRQRRIKIYKKVKNNRPHIKIICISCHKTVRLSYEKIPWWSGYNEGKIWDFLECERSHKQCKDEVYVSFGCTILKNYNIQIKKWLEKQTFLPKDIIQYHLIPLLAS